MSTNNPISVTYEKYYMDDLGTNIPEIFSSKTINSVSINKYWSNTIDAFMRSDCTHYLVCLYGALRIVVPHEQSDKTYKFSQYFISGIDGKIIHINPNIWFGIHNLNNDNSILLNGKDKIPNYETMSHKIFNWSSKRS